MANQIDNYVKRPIRYRNIDGLGELCVGVLFTGSALLVLHLRATPSSSFWHVYVVVLVCIVALSFALFYGRSALKKRLTYPRTGYVKYRQAGKRARLIGLIAGVLAGIAGGTTIESFVGHFAPHSHETGLIVGTSAICLFYIFGTRMDAAWRWVVLVALIVAPLVVATLPLSQLRLDTFLAEGLIFAASGSIALTHYLRRNPVPEQGAE